MNERENLQNIIKYEFINTRRKCPYKLISEVIGKHRKVFTHYTGECKYDLAFKDKDGWETTTTVYYPAHIKNHSQIEENENRVYKFWKKIDYIIP